MEKWSYRNYKRPYLDISGISILDGKRILINSPVGSFDIELTTETSNIKVIKKHLVELQQGCHERWANLNDGNYSILESIVTSLDEAGLVISSEDPSKKLARYLSDLNKECALTAKYMKSNYSLDSNTNLTNFLLIIDECLRNIFCESTSSKDSYPNKQYYKKPENNTGNFYVDLLFYQIQYLRESHPLALNCWLMSLSKLCDMENIFQDHEGLIFFNNSWEELTCDLVGSALNHRDISIYQNALTSHLMDSQRPSAKSLFIKSDCDDGLGELMSGINFMVKIEKTINNLLEKINNSSFIKTLHEGVQSDSAFVRGIFIEQYHVNRRFVEIISPLINKRFSDSLKIRIFKYYEEEYGHEEFEIGTCKSLNISHEDLLQSCPLPLMQSYVDVFTIIAAHDPIGFFASAMITEGMIGKPSLLFDVLEKMMVDNKDYQKVARLHDTLNNDVNHAYLSRLFMNDIEIITPKTQLRALKHIIFLLELNHRSLEQLTDYYKSQTTLKLYNEFISRNADE